MNSTVALSLFTAVSYVGRVKGGERGGGKEGASETLRRETGLMEDGPRFMYPCRPWGKGATLDILQLT